MRRTARALSVAVLASAALGVFAGAGAADPGVPPPPTGAGEPVEPPAPDDSGAVPPPSVDEGLHPAAGQAAARVTPADVAPGGTVTVSVSCGPTGGAAPATLDATSAAFDAGTVVLRKVAGDEGTASGPAYRGTARIAAAEDFEAEGPTENRTDTEDAQGATKDSDGAADDWTVDGACPDASGGEGDPWSATMTVPGEGVAGAAEPGCRESAEPRAGTSTHGTACATAEPACPEPATPRGGPSAQGTSCGGATAEHGVRAGTGGTFGDSVPALVAGGVLIAGACGAAAHRLRLRVRGEDGQR
ncbi:hypothetical protein [Streptomyces sp. NPDC048392]|uniref:hypothetical protein n=1 Tax=Streptomyces sp. NPDC048392 TaxID=3365543 RepID=UPI00371B0D06